MRSKCPYTFPGGLFMLDYAWVKRLEKSSASQFPKTVVRIGKIASYETLRMSEHSIHDDDLGDVPASQIFCEVLAFTEHVAPTQNFFDIPAAVF
jgi:hypothetical protein